MKYYNIPICEAYNQLILEEISNKILLAAKKAWSTIPEEEFKPILDNFLTNIRVKIQAPNNDINFWFKKPFEEFKAFIENYRSNTEKKTEQKYKAQKTKDGKGKKISETQNYELWQVDSYEAAKELGRFYKGYSTHWCISTDNPDHWDGYYIDENIRFYFIIHKTNQPNMEKINKTVEKLGRWEPQHSDHQFTLSRHISKVDIDTKFAIAVYSDNHKDIWNILDINEEDSPDINKYEASPELKNIIKNLKWYDNIDMVSDEDKQRIINANLLNCDTAAKVKEVISRYNININKPLEFSNGFSIPLFLNKIHWGHMETAIDIFKNIPELDIYCTDSTGENVLLYLAKKTHNNTSVEFFKLLVSKYKFDINKTTNTTNILMSAVLHNNNELIEFLSTYPGIDINIQDPIDKCTPLMIALMSSAPYYYGGVDINKEMIKSLLKFPNINWNIKLSSGRTLQDFCKMYLTGPSYKELYDSIMSHYKKT